ncbi:GspH/FimT family pseudopilin [Microbulbifer rhizosphaerae]|uniref:Type II secretion system protein H n=1 Tax=Microbulbifer rhizosphaerae TaxID=1562603 RepID=A0A7W4Z9V1_9GAMM|nr:GspH/FimT family pseudopilin [Microbulbifer rhizosphaerae]MBB3060644.1 prepilin-type N-terminal cleavage/methylation domain-containing protein [Microbulbifer rhizosphaerae]
MTVPRPAAGFTLIELMCVIAILAIVIAIGVPSFSTMIKDNRAVTAINDLNATLQYARAEAVRRGGRVGVGAIDSDVNNGLRVWADDGNGNFEDGEEVLRVFTIDSGNITVAAAVGGTDNQDIDFTFNGRGLVSGLTDMTTFGLCDDRAGNYGRQLTLLTSGVVRLTTDIACTGSQEK